MLSSFAAAAAISVLDGSCPLLQASKACLHCRIAAGTFILASGTTPNRTLSLNVLGLVWVPCQWRLVVLEAWKQLGKLLASAPGYDAPVPPAPVTVSHCPKALVTEVLLNWAGSTRLRKITSICSPTPTRNV